MRWVVPIKDEVRLKTKFLLWPTKLKNDLTGRIEWRWLEMATIKQRYQLETCWLGRSEGYHTYAWWENESFN